MLPTLREFVEKLVRDHGCRIKNLANIPGLPDVSKERLSRPYMDRMLPSGKWVYAYLPQIPQEQILLPTEIRAICEHLQIDPAEFGATIH